MLIDQEAARRKDILLYVCMALWGIQMAFRPQRSLYEIPHIVQLIAPLRWTNLPPVHLLAASSVGLAIAGLMATNYRHSFAMRACAVASSGFWTYSLAGTLVTDIYAPVAIFYGVCLALTFPTALGRPRGNG